MIELYTDGAIRKGVPYWAFVVVEKGKVIAHKVGKVVGPDDLIKQRNVAAEMMAVLKALNWAIQNKVQKARVVYDYLGLGKWPDGEWRANTYYTKKYAKTVNTFRKSIDLKMKWVKGHSGNKWNEVVDQLASKGVKP